MVLKNLEIVLFGGVYLLIECIRKVKAERWSYQCTRDGLEGSDTKAFFLPKFIPGPSFPALHSATLCIAEFVWMKDNCPKDICRKTFAQRLLPQAILLNQTFTQYKFAQMKIDICPKRCLLAQIKQNVKINWNLSKCFSKWKLIFFKLENHFSSIAKKLASQQANKEHYLCRKMSYQRGKQLNKSLYL